MPNDDESVDTGMDVLDQWLSHATFDPGPGRGRARGRHRRVAQPAPRTVAGRLFEVAAGHVPRGHAVRRTAIRSAADDSIATVPVEELPQFYDNWYRPDNAAVVVVGDIDVDAIVDRHRPSVSATASAAHRGDAGPRPTRRSRSRPSPTSPSTAIPIRPPSTSRSTCRSRPSRATARRRLRARILDSMIYTALIRRLDQDVTAGDARRSTRSPPAPTRSSLARRTGPVRDHHRRPGRRHPAGAARRVRADRPVRVLAEAETDVAKPQPRPNSTRCTRARNTTQDVDYADQYVANFLTGEPYPTTEMLYELATAIDRGDHTRGARLAVPGPLAAHGAARDHLDTRARGGRRCRAKPRCWR